MTEANRIKVMLVDDQNMIRQGFGYILSLQPDLQIVGEAGNGNDAVKMAEELHPDVILMDVQMPFMDGIEATKRIMAQQTGVKIVILTTFDDQDYVLEGIRAGAVGYLLKDAEASDMIEAIRAAYRGEAIYKTKLASGALQEAIASASLSAPDNVLQVKLLEPLTEREQEILQEMAYGLRNEQIAAKLFITEGTVKSHVHRILQKFGCEDRTQVVVMALRGGLVK
ncbi:response regulator [Paenibacillus barengoltzii]|jgi:DNA-binding NarL/FixJ family response regulator|uniref:response regulator n=1 Tax=Paenibacillus barengoltzii TaxID=343517 RepID=UPI000A088AAE|nr:response regulator transcription factor [Paenibacillus barengoltzii]SME96470.1 two component transcriptional regulator, LuxR family [Paenibacillus barengoltzii]